MKTVLGLLKADEGEIVVNGEKVVYGQTSTNKFIGYLPDVPEFYNRKSHWNFKTGANRAYIGNSVYGGG